MEIWADITSRLPPFNHLIFDSLIQQLCIESPAGQGLIGTRDMVLNKTVFALLELYSNGETASKQLYVTIMDWIVFLHEKLIFELLTSNVTVFGNKAFRK